MNLAQAVRKLFGRADDSSIRVQQQRLERKAMLRAFAAAQRNRMTDDWIAEQSSINQELRSDAAAIRRRARRLVKDTDHGKQFLRQLARNVIGPYGYTLQSRAKLADGKADEEGNKAIEAAYRDWCASLHCDVSKRSNFVTLCRLVLQGTATDGEFLVRKVYGRGKYGFALQVLDVERIDTSYHTQLVNGNLVKMGVEIDSFGVAQAIYLLTKHPGEDAMSYQRTTRERVPMSDLIHGFVPIQAEQVRGVSWFHAVITRMHTLSGFEEAAVFAARAGASKMGFFIDNSETGVDPAMLADATDSGDLMTHVEPGVLQKLPPGVTFESFNPDYPHQFYDSFLKAALRSVAAGLGIDTVSLTGDLTDVNYSSARVGMLASQDEWKAIQDWFEGAFLRPVVEEWLLMALGKRQVLLPSSGRPLPAERYQKFRAAIKFQARRWSWVDPEKEANAAGKAIDTRITSRTRICAEQGEDFDEVIEDLQREEQKLRELGLLPEQQAQPTPTPPQRGKESVELHLHQAGKKSVKTVYTRDSDGNINGKIEEVMP